MTGKAVGAEAESLPRPQGADRRRGSRLSQALRRPGCAFFGGLVIFALVILGIWYFGNDHDFKSEAAEAQAVMASQANIPSQTLIPAEEIKINDQGVQEFTLVITPGGYNPIRFSVKQGVPVKVTFRMLGQVGCGNTLIFPVGGGKTEGAVLKSEKDKALIEFTPQEAGDFQFFCGHGMFRGIMTVRP